MRMLSLAAAAAEDAEFGAMRVVERDPAERPREGGAEVETWVVGQQGAGDDGDGQHAE